jgi:predicted ATPase
VQAGLADFLIEVSHRGVGVIVETHSEHIVTRLQRRIAEEALKPERIALYYVTPSPEGSKVERVEVNEYGQIPGAPKAFFEHGFEETFDLVRAIGERKRQERPVEDDD